MAGKSRYQSSPMFTEAEPGKISFDGMRPRVIGAATGVIEHTISQTDRLDSLANHYYVDSRKWWRILDANPDILFAGDLSLSEYVGETIIIPRAKEPGGAM